MLQLCKPPPSPFPHPPRPTRYIPPPSHIQSVKRTQISAILVFPARLNACVQFFWSSYSTAPSVIPASALFYTTPISGSPYNISVVPGAAAYPYTDAYGEGVKNASAGVSASFVIQAKVGLCETLHYLADCCGGLWWFYMCEKTMKSVIGAMI